MTFLEIEQDICDRLGITSPTDTARVGRAINRKYREITASLGIKHLSRRTTVQATCTLGVSTVQFTSAEKVVNVFNRNVTPYQQLGEVTVDELEMQMPFSASDCPTQYAVQQLAGDACTILVNCVPQTALVLYAEVYSTAGTLSGMDEPVFPESYHDILIDLVLVDEYLKTEKPSLAKIAKENVYGPPGRPEDGRMAQLRHANAVSTTKKDYAGKTGEQSRLNVGSGGSGGSGSVNGALSYTQTGLVTFDRAGLAPFAVVDDTVITDLNADLLDGQHGSYYRSASNLNTGTVPDAQFPATLPVASGVNLTALNASNLASGQVAAARLATAFGAWTAYTPTWGNTGTANTLGNGTLTGQYTQVGKLLWFRLLFEFGSTTVSGNGAWTFTYPPVSQAEVTYTGSPGSAILYDISVGAYTASYGTYSAGSFVIFAAGAVNGLTASAPFTWVNTDRLTVQGFYEAA